MTQLHSHIAEFASLLAPAQGNDTGLTTWIAAVRACELPHLHAFANGLELDRAVVNAALTTPHHKARTEGVNTRPNASCGKYTDTPDSSFFATASFSRTLTQSYHRK